jgi:hypothetical protein
MRRIGITLAAVALAGATAAVLYCVPPAPGGIYPPCMLHALTGLHCPGCGATRCTYALLHGDLRQAAAYNLLYLLLLPVLLTWAMRVGFRFVLGDPNPIRPLPTRLIWALFAVLLAFGIMRNLPFPPFNLLAPHELP